MTDFEHIILGICFIQILSGIIYRVFFKYTQQRKKQIFEEYAKENKIVVLRKGDTFTSGNQTIMVTDVVPTGWSTIVIKE